MPSFASLLPALPGFAGPKTYAAWPVWSDSTRAEVKFHPVSKKLATRLYHKARTWNRTEKVAGRYGGALGSSALRVLEALIFDFLNHASGRLDPSYEAIARKTGLGRSTVAEALKRLKELRVIAWLRRCVPSWQDGRYVLEQETNAYSVLPPSHWHGFRDPEPPAPPPHPSTWGATPPLPELVDQAATRTREGAAIGAVVALLEADPGDHLAAALARLGRAIDGAGGGNS